MFQATDADGEERTVAEEVRVIETHTARHGEYNTTFEIETDLPDSHDTAVYVESSVYYTLTEDVGVDPEAYRIHRFEPAEN